MCYLPIRNIGRNQGGNGYTWGRIESAQRVGLRGIGGGADIPLYASPGLKRVPFGFTQATLRNTRRPDISAEIRLRYRVFERDDVAGIGLAFFFAEKAVHDLAAMGFG